MGKHIVTDRPLGQATRHKMETKFRETLAEGSLGPLPDKVVIDTGDAALASSQASHATETVVASDASGLEAYLPEAFGS